METAGDADRWSSDSLIRFARTLLKCKLCTAESVMFTSKEAFISHVKGFHLDEERDFKCSCCPLKFRSNEDLLHHVDQDHPGIIPDIRSDKTPSKNSGSANSISSSAKQDKQVVSYKESDEELQAMYDRHASTIIIDNKQYYYCALCGFKFSSHIECQGHFTGTYHAQKIQIQEVSTTTNVEQKPDSKPRSRRKRSLPMPCRRQVTDNSDTEIVEEADAKISEDIIPWTASNPLRFSLMQSDRKRLALSCPKELDKHAHKNSMDYHYKNGENGINGALNFSSIKTESQVFERTELLKSVMNVGYEMPQDLSTKAKPDMQLKSLKTGETSSKYDVTSPKLNVMMSSKYDVTSSKLNVMLSKYEVTSSKCDVTSLKREVISHKCHRCDAEFPVLEDLCSHYKETHMGAQHSAMGDQYFKVIWLKHLLPQFVIAHESGCVSRDELLVRMAIVADENALWGPACNKAVRETFPDSTAMRKGKFKKTYYFGITYVDSSAPSASPGLETSDEDATVNEEDEETRSDPGAPPSSHQEVDKLVHMLPEVVQYTGSADSSVARETILGMLSSKLGDSGVLTWAGQCNKAVRQAFPHVSLRRKGKYKTTFYFGLELTKEKKKFTGSIENSHKPSTWMNTPTSSGAGPPVVNVKDLEECQGPLQFSRLISSPGKPPMADLSFLNDIINKVEATANSSSCVEKETRTSNSPQSTMVAPLTMPVEVAAVNSTRGQQPSPPIGNNNHLENLEKLILLHPGPFVTARIFSRRFQRLAPNTDKVLAAMTMLQGRGLGQVFTLKTGNSKVFFKAAPSKSLEVSLSVLGVRFIDYQVMFSERDSKLEDSLHDRLRAFYPQPDVLVSFYNH